MKNYHKEDYPVADIRRFLEPGPVVLVSSTWKGESDIMTMGWNMLMEFTPSLLGCFISDANHSYEMIKCSMECVINLPTADMVDQVVAIGNCSGEDTDKFTAFGLTPQPAELVGAPLIAECYANFECKLAQVAGNPKGGFFIFECVKAHVATSPKLPETLHYRGNGEFMVSGRTISRKSLMKPEIS